MCMCVCVRSLSSVFEMFLSALSPLVEILPLISRSVSNTCASVRFVLITTARCDLFPSPAPFPLPPSSPCVFFFLQHLSYTLLWICINYIHLFHLTKSVNLLRIGTMFCFFIHDLVCNIQELFQKYRILVHNLTLFLSQYFLLLKSI